MKKYLLIGFAMLMLSARLPAQAIGNLNAATTTCLVSNSCLEQDISPNIGGVTFKLSGTFNAVIQFEASADPLTISLASTNWVALSVTPSNSSTAVTSTTQSGSNLSLAWQANVSAYRRVRMRVSTYTSGTVAGAINLSTASARGGSGGGGGGGTITGSGAATDIAIFSGASAITGTSALTSSGGGIAQVVDGNATNAGFLTDSSTGDEVLTSFVAHALDITAGPPGLATFATLDLNTAGAATLISSATGPVITTLQLNFDTLGSAEILTAAGSAGFSTNLKTTSPAYATTSNCAANGSAANPSVAACGSAAAGMFSCATAASTGTCQVNTTKVTANSEIQVISTAADGGAAQLNVTCNTAFTLPTTKPTLLSKNTGVSFTISLGTVAVNPGCYEYTITN